MEKVSPLLSALPCIWSAITTVLHHNVTAVTGSTLRQCQTHTHTHTLTGMMQSLLGDCVREDN